MLELLEHRWSSFTPLQALQNRFNNKIRLLKVLLAEKLLWLNWTCCVLLTIIAGFPRATASLFFNDKRKILEKLILNGPRAHAITWNDSGKFGKISQRINEKLSFVVYLFLTTDPQTAMYLDIIYGLAALVGLLIALIVSFACYKIFKRYVVRNYKQNLVNTKIKKSMMETNDILHFFLWFLTIKLTVTCDNTLWLVVRSSFRLGQGTQ